MHCSRGTASRSPPHLVSSRAFESLPLAFSSSRRSDRVCACSSGGHQGGCKAEHLDSLPPSPALHTEGAFPSIASRLPEGISGGSRSTSAGGRVGKCLPTTMPPWRCGDCFLRAPAVPARREWVSPCRTLLRSSLACFTGCSASSEAQDMSLCSSTEAELGASLSTT